MDTVSHPSEFITEEMEARGWSRVDLAIAMGADRFARNKMVLDVYFAVGPARTGCRFGADFAARLGHAFGVSPQFFHNLEREYLAATAQLPVASD